MLSHRSLETHGQRALLPGLGGGPGRQAPGAMAPPAGHAWYLAPRRLQAHPRTDVSVRRRAAGERKHPLPGLESQSVPVPEKRH